ncbi:MAG: helix-turn-helix transcriptional regulator, partial [Sphingomonadales bacterium]|nr:helix-turn-helix transcriptional regulator [Sphingomonadales bacterium]
MIVAAHFQTLPAASATPRASRRRLLLETEGTTRDVSTAAVRIHNVSSTGLLLETTVPLSPSERIEVDLPHAGITVAQVAWSNQPFHGCRFDAPLSSATLSALELRATPLPLPGPPAADDEAFAARLQRLRKDRGLTLAAIADVLGVSKPTVWAWEQGRSRPTAEHMRGLARTLGLDETELAGNRQSARLQAVLGQARQQLAEALEIDPAKIRIMV